MCVREEDKVTVVHLMLRALYVFYQLWGDIEGLKGWHISYFLPLVIKSLTGINLRKDKLILAHSWGLWQGRQSCRTEVADPSAPTDSPFSCFSFLFSSGPRPRGSAADILGASSLC